MKTPQIIEGLSHEQYRKIVATHSGLLRKILISPLAYSTAKADEDAGIDEDSDVLILGRATHTATLEPSKFAKQYVCWAKSAGSRRGKAWDAYVSDAEKSGQTILTEAQLDQAVAISKAVRAHEVSGPILKEKGRAEVTIVWTHPRTGVVIKVRVDWLTSKRLVDLKSCRSPAPGMFSTSCASLGYHFQMALYADAAAGAGLGSLDVSMIAAQSAKPHDVVVYDVPEDVLFQGRAEYERALDLLVECRKFGKWPGIAPSEPLKLKLPEWIYGQGDDDTAGLIFDEPEKEPQL